MGGSIRTTSPGQINPPPPRRALEAAPDRVTNSSSRSTSSTIPCRTLTCSPCDCAHMDSSPPWAYRRESTESSSRNTLAALCERVMQMMAAGQSGLSRLMRLQVISWRKHAVNSIVLSGFRMVALERQTACNQYILRDHCNENADGEGSTVFRAAIGRGRTREEKKLEGPFRLACPCAPDVVRIEDNATQVLL